MSAFQEVKSDEDTLAIKCRRFNPHPNVNFGNREALLYNILRDEGCSFKKSLIFSTKKNCRIDNTKTLDGPIGFRILKQKQIPGFLTNRGWFNSQPVYDFNNEQFVSVKEFQKEDSFDIELNKKFDSCSLNIKKDLMRSLYYLKQNNKILEEKYNFSKIKSRKLQSQKIKEFTEITRKQRQNQKVFIVNNIQFSQLAEELFELRKKMLNSEYTDVMDNLNSFQDVLLFDLVKTSNLKYQYETKMELDNVAINPNQNIIEDLKNKQSSIWNYEEKHIEKLKQNFQNILKKVDDLTEVQKAEYIQKLIKLHNKKQNITQYNSQFYLFDENKNQEALLQQIHEQQDNEDNQKQLKNKKIGLSKQDRQKLDQKKNLEQLNEQNIDKQNQFSILVQNLVVSKEINFQKQLREQTPQIQKDMQNSPKIQSSQTVQQNGEIFFEKQQEEDEDIEYDLVSQQQLMDPYKFQKNLKIIQRKFSQQKLSHEVEQQEPENLRSMQKLEFELSIKDSQKSPKNYSIYQLDSNKKNFYNHLDKLCQTKQEFLQKFINRNFIQPGKNQKQSQKSNIQNFQNSIIKNKSLHNNSNLPQNSNNQQIQQQQKNESSIQHPEVKKLKITKEQLKLNLNFINKQDISNNQSQINQSSNVSNNQTTSKFMKSVRFNKYLSKTTRNQESPDIVFDKPFYLTKNTKKSKLAKQYIHQPLQNIENYQKFMKIQTFQESFAAQSLQVSPRESLHNFSNMMQSNLEILQ